MRLVILVACSLVISLVNAQQASQPSASQRPNELRQIHVLVRHGDRTPTFEFPKDTNSKWKEGKGQLTKLGKQQMYQLGTFVKSTYSSFLNGTYHAKEVYVRSSDKDRTLASALVAMAAIYEPVTEEQQWKEGFKWQPVPVHTVDLSEDYLLRGHTICPRFKSLEQEFLDNSSEVAEANEKFKLLFENLTKETGVEIKNIKQALKVQNTLKVQQIHNRPLAPWAVDTLQQLDQVRNKKYVWKYGTKELRQLAVGQLLKEMLDNMQKATEGKSKQKLFFYSAHSATVAGFLSALDIYNDLTVPYATAVIVEFLQKGDTDYRVQVVFKNDTVEDSSRDPLLLKVPGCDDLLCPLKQFREVAQQMIPEGEIADACKSASGATMTRAGFGITVSAIVIFVSKFMTNI